MLLTVLTVAIGALTPSPAGAIMTTNVTCNGVPDVVSMLDDTLTIAFSATELGFPATVRTCPTGFTEIRVTGDEAVQVLSFSATAGFTAIVDLLGGDDELTMVSSSQPVLASGGSGSDTIRGGDAADTLHGDGGDDSLLGGGGIDALDGGLGRDTATWEDRGEPVAASLVTDVGAEDTLTAIEDLLGGTGNDTLIGDAGPNILRGNDGDDNMQGGEGDDTLQGSFGRDRLDGGGGTDASTWEERTEPVVASLLNDVGAEDDLVAIENLTGSGGDDTLIGDDGVNVLRGQEGKDVLRGGLGSDVLDGGADVDTATWEERADAITASLLSHLGGVRDEDRLPGIENLIGGRGDDTLIGDDGPNVLRGNDGNDVLRGGLGVDTLNGGSGLDTATWEDRDDAVIASLVARAGAEDTLVQIDNLTGSHGNDTLIGDDRPNVLRGGDGDDGLQGGADADTLHGGFGRDVFAAGDGNDTLDAFDGERDFALDCGPGDDTVTSDAIADDPVSRAGCETELFGVDRAGDPRTAGRSPNTCVGVRGTRGWCGDGSPALSARLGGPADVAVAADGSLVIADTRNNVIRRVKPGRGGKFGAIATIAGNGARGPARDADARRATFDAPEGVAVLAGGAVLVADTGNDAIRAITGDGTVLTVRASGARIDAPRDVVALRDGSVLIANTGRHEVLRLRPDSSVSRIAGTGQRGFSGDGGQADEASLNTPTQLSVAPDGALLIADTGNGAIRRVSPKGMMTTFARGLDEPRGVLAEPDGDVLVSTPSRIIGYHAGNPRTIAGTRAGFNGDREAKVVRLDGLSQFSVSRANHVLVAEQGNDRIRELVPRRQALRAIAQGTGTNDVKTVGGSGAKQPPILSTKGLSPGTPPRSMRNADDGDGCTKPAPRFNEFYARPGGTLIAGASERVEFTLVSTRSAQVVVQVFRLVGGRARGAVRFAHRQRGSRHTVGLRRRGNYVLKLWGLAGPPATLRCHIRKLRITGR